MTDSVGLRPGERAIQSAQLEAVPNPAPERDYRIDISFPEFTCLCPRSGYPDFAMIRISYVPDRSIVELKALKLYLNRFRGEYLFHEAAINRILDDLLRLTEPRWMRVSGVFTPRGNVSTTVTAEHARPGFAMPPLALERP